MLTGFQGSGTPRFGCTFFVLITLSFAYVAIYAVWAGNNLAYIVDDPDADRYVTLEFWRLIFPFLNIPAPLATTLLLYNDTSLAGFYPYGLHIIIVVGCAVISAVWLAWFIVDVISCSSVVYCIGDGNGPFGVDVAFFVAAVAQSMLLGLDFIFLFGNFFLKGKVQSAQILDATAYPNRQPFYPDSTARLMQQSYTPTAYISDDIELRMRGASQNTGGTNPDTSYPH